MGIRILSEAEVDSPSYVANNATDVVNYGAHNGNWHYMYRGIPFAVKRGDGTFVSYLDDTDDIPAFANEQGEQQHATQVDAVNYWAGRIQQCLGAVAVDDGWMQL